LKTPICDRLGCEVPIFAFSHCRDVVVEVTKAGGFGVLGAVTFSPEQLELELKWIDDHVGGKSYGVDVLIPSNYDRAAEEAEEPVVDLIPGEQKQFVDKLLDAEGVPALSADDAQEARRELMGRGRNTTPSGARKLVEVALRHPQVKLVVSALGAPPRDLVEDLHGRGILVGSLCGKAEHARAQREAGVDIIVAQGTEAGGHTGQIATMVLVPQVVDVAGPDIAVLAAGGISRGKQIAAAFALGAQGVWTGTIWLGTRESELTPMEKDILFKARSEDAVQRKWMTGKTVRMIRSKASEAWEQAGAPKHLKPPLQNILYHGARIRIEKAHRADLCSFPAGQVVGNMREETSVRQVMQDLMEEYIETAQRMAPLVNL
jgi:NAD(P)H-dependent flavin oxidoreductase YrpB (nitropropane dioxygenase family)